MSTEHERPNTEREQNRPAPATHIWDLPDPAWCRRFRTHVWRWYRRHARDLPWRRTRDPYAIWVSEIMLQQTQVDTVKGYYERFLKAFPTIESLAAAELPQVLRMWEGLGYYRRARHLHAAARVLAAAHDGEFPRDIKVVRQLPGIGRYTAGAILSLSFDQPQPILEANTMRLFSRLLAYEGDVSRAAGQKRLWGLAEAILPRRGSGELNQALMELGSLVCTPQQPRCGACPVQALCGAALKGVQDRIPGRTKRLDYQQTREAAVVVRDRGQVVLRQCGEQERWAGLWDFPRYAIRQRGAALRRELRALLRAHTGLDVEIGAALTTIKHGVTRYRIMLECFAAEPVNGRRLQKRCAAKWVRVTALERYPLSVTGRKIARLLSGAEDRV